VVFLLYLIFGIYAFPKIQTIGGVGLVFENIYKGQENILIPFLLVTLHYKNFYINGKNIGW